jgi:predicted nucleic acid-binding protein
MPRCPRNYTGANLYLGKGFLAGKCFLKYRRQGGARTSPLPDFYIGAHAAVGNLALLTRDAADYRTYFRRLEIIAP